jgi:hypothetical protein
MHVVKMVHERAAQVAQNKKDHRPQHVLGGLCHGKKLTETPADVTGILAFP